ncbi:hormone-sensitive lipase isoform X2 [Lycorma delicatula]|uniref:hormone-sensitive lipase isoform X2 n=1 Tax=Lycorma delicatula TaxID=130591 RepID=UPI003F511ED1
MTDCKSEIINKNDNDSTSYVMYDALKNLCESNADYFKSDTSNIGKNLYSTSLSVINNIVSIKPLVDHFRNTCAAYDFDENTPGNGYRSYVMMVDAFVNYAVKINRQICVNRNSYFFRKGTALKELEACEQGLSSLCQMLTHLMVLIEWSDEGCLYPREEHPPEELLARANNLNQYCFYGRCLGFQFCESMQTVLKALGILMASFSELYYSNGGVIGRATSSLWNSSKYLLNPELRAKRIVNISQYASVNFCKQFWFLGEMVVPEYASPAAIETMKRLPNFVSPSVVMNRIIVIPPEPMTIQRVDGTTFDVPIPSSHTGPSPLSVRLMSSVKRQGMLGEAGSKNLAPVADGFIFHCHGGGFVAQSSRSHETYLCQWVKSIDVPLLSVDYSLAPEAPFPRALEDTFYAYCWALNHLNILGTTGRRIVAAGDSAGGNLILGLTIKCITEGIRPPDGLFLAYVPVIVSIIPSPARLLCLMDPLLPLGFLTGCLRAYACTPEAYETAVKGFEEKLRHQSSKQHHSSDGNIKPMSSGRYNSVDVEVDLLENLTTSTDCVKLKDNVPSNNLNSNDYNNESNFVAGFLDKYVNDNNSKELDDSNCADKMQIVPDDHILLDRVPETKVEFQAPPSEEQQDNGNCNVNRKGSSSRLSNLAAAIGNTFTSFTNSGSGNSGNPLVNGKSSSASSNGDLISPASTVNSNEDFEEVMLPCPLEMLKFEVPNNPLLSPYYADDEILKKFPPISFMTLHMDPCLDDCVEFAKKLKRLDNKVTIDILEGLPHGFLNFSLLSKEAYEASKKCIERIKTLLGILPPITVNNDGDVEKGEDVINNSENSDINSPSPMIKTIAENTNVFTF